MPAKRMQAWTVKEYGYYKDVLREQELPRPEPEPGTALIRVGATGLSFALMLKIAGQYQIKDPLPFIPGMDAAGEVIAVGEGCVFRPGMRIMGIAAGGSLAEYALLRCEDSHPVPDSMSDTQAAAFLNVYLTSYVGLLHNGRMQPGDIVLVHGGAGGVGLAAIQIAKAKGCTVIATASSAEKLAACREQGADHVVNYAVDDFVQAVQEYTAGHGADIVYDPVGGDVFDQSRRCIAFGGRLVVVGFASGRIPEIAANRILLRNFSVTGFTLHGYKEHRPQVLADSHADLIQLHAAGHVRPVISHTLPMSRLLEGIELLETRRSIGKVVMVPGGPA